MNVTASLHASLRYEVVSVTTPVYDGNDDGAPNPWPRPWTVRVPAPEGMKVVGGGWEGDVARARPSDDGSEWIVEMASFYGGSVTAWAICVAVC